METSLEQQQQPCSPSTSTSTRSSPSTLATSPTLTPPKSPEMYRQSYSPPTTGDSPLPPLPAEVYFLIIKNIPPADRYFLLLVSRTWKTCLEGEPQLWPCMWVDLEVDQRRRNELWVSRAGSSKKQSGGGVKELSVNLAATQVNSHAFGDIAPVGPVLQRFNHLLEVLGSSCVSAVVHDGHSREETVSTLAALRMILNPNTIAVIHILHTLLEKALDPLLRDLQSLNIAARIPHLCLTGTFFASWPNLSSLSIFSAPPTSHVRDIPTDVPWAWGRPTSRRHQNSAVLPYLLTLHLTGTVLSRQLELPWLPALTSLHLIDVIWEGRAFFLLMRWVRKTLVNLSCHGLAFEEIPEDGWKDFQTYIDIRDPGLIDSHLITMPNEEDDELEAVPEPAPIIFSRLEVLSLSSDRTPPLFSSLEHFDVATDSAPFPTPIFVMPKLQQARFEDTLLEEETYIEDSDGALAVLGRSAPDVTDLSVINTCASNDSIFFCLAGMSARMVCLNLENSNAADVLLARLPGLTPLLEELNVRQCTEITLQGVARLVEVMRDTSMGEHRIKRVKVDPPEWGDAEYYAWLWLDWVSVLVRAEYDFEGNGPRAMRDQYHWRRQGKKDAEAVSRQKRLEREEYDRKIAADHLANLQREYGFSASSGGSRIAVVVPPIAQSESSSSSPLDLSPTSSSETIPDEHAVETITIRSSQLPQTAPTLDPRRRARAPSPGADRMDTRDDNPTESSNEQRDEARRVRDRKALSI